eukprot:7205017-Pyramimonas_sp.AAC.1
MHVRTHVMRNSAEQHMLEQNKPGEWRSFPACRLQAGSRFACEEVAPNKTWGLLTARGRACAIIEALARAVPCRPSAELTCILRTVQRDTGAASGRAAW